MADWAANGDWSTNGDWDGINGAPVGVATESESAGSIIALFDQSGAVVAAVEVEAAFTVSVMAQSGQTGWGIPIGI